MIILGIDPGLAATGYGIIKKENDNFSLINYGCLRTDAHFDFSRRLQDIHNGLKKIIKEFFPEIIAVEELFFAKNVKTALLVGQARGVVLLTAMQSHLPFYEYTPLQVKQAVSGYGRADKRQIQEMVKTLLNLKESPKPDDAADALAVAICCGNSIKQGPIGNFVKK